MKVLKDLPITTRDSTVLYADVFLPDEGGSHPALVTLSPYQKDVPWFVPEGHTAAHHEYQCWETPDPVQWTAAGYATVRVDARGSGKSGGIHAIFSHQEATDYYDAIEWVATQDWCTGNVGATGISYYAMSQWRVAALAPPSLKAFVPWSGSADAYREFVYRGGLMAHDFFSQWYTRLVADHYHGKAQHAPVAYGEEDAFRTFVINDLDGPFWDERRPDGTRIDIPFLSASSWHAWRGPGHIRGNLEMFKDSPCEHKRLRVSTGNYFLEYYSDEVFAEQRAWFDYWLKGETSEAYHVPRVRVQLQSSSNEAIWRNEEDWPLPDTETMTLYLGDDSSGAGALGMESQREGSVQYEAPGELSVHAEPILGAMGDDTGAIFLSAPFQETTDLVGEAALDLWAASSYDDMDIHVYLSLVSANGDLIDLSRGWLKASQRELDPARSTQRRPYHAHTRRTPLTPGEKVEMHIEIWPFAVRIQPGERLRLRIAGSGAGYLSGWHRRPRGTHTVYFGGAYPSHLALPFVGKP
ncbi:CocE/NonD family hydrolase [Halomonas sp. LR5S13]|uniref:CocE/NonD family hydrolase n=1 Tax=Halomonas rhizosphaerae TaxID=3043296 RepID=UPI0024A88CE0|nr:CocE/NonD family hydrolase [Halomonas rhizosphaerae]MDI5922659.1 CocE/NonD family hydrolase [Halomonas rhizosphaerae]